MNLKWLLPHTLFNKHTHGCCLAQTFLSLCCSSLKELFSPRSFSKSKQGSLAPSSRPCCTRCCMLEEEDSKRKHIYILLHRKRIQTPTEGCVLYSVMVVSRSLSLRFWSSSCASLSWSCERVVSRVASSSFTVSCSWATCCSDPKSWNKEHTDFMFMFQKSCMVKVQQIRSGHGADLLVLALVVL